MDELNVCFKSFDEIITDMGLEKIKTIGDAYMAAGGLPEPDRADTKEVVKAALRMQDFIEDRKAERVAAGQIPFVMRVGIHTGPVIAGIVGVKKFQYDIWGDAVNTASRMESQFEPGKVNVSEAVYLKLQHDPDFKFIPRGSIEAKGKGMLKMYFVEWAKAG